MTSDQWLASTDPQAMLRLVQSSSGASERKMRLFAVACCRHIWHLLAEKPYRQAVEVAERFADGQADQEELADARAMAEQVAMRGQEGGGRYGPLWDASWFKSEQAGAWANAHDPDAPAVLAFAAAQEKAGEIAELCLPWAVALGVEAAVQQRLLRDIFGPFPGRAMSPLASSVRAWNDGLVVRMAESIYEERVLPSGHLNSDRLAVLADALLDAGCPAEHPLLRHLREPGVHVRGCHAVNALLGRD
jgi:hypothetical protein